jgi:hypothetical protein
MGSLRLVWIVLAIPLLAASDGSRGVPPPPSPSFAPPAHGVLFADDFSHDLSAWRADMPGVWSIRRRVLRADLPDKKQVRSLLWAGDSTWTDYALDFDCCMVRGVDKGAVVRGRGALGVGVDLRGGTYQDVVAYVRDWPVGKGAAVNANAVWNHVQIEVVGDRLRVSVNGDLKIDHRQTRAHQGRIALAAYTGGAGQCTVYYDNVVVTTRAGVTLPEAGESRGDGDR